MSEFNLEMNGKEYDLMNPERVEEEIANGNAVVITLKKERTRDSEER